MSNIMLDLESMSTAPDAALIAIGAVRFSQTEITDRYHEIVELKSCMAAGLRADADTIVWWMQQSESARSVFQTGPIPPVKITKALLRFSEWVGPENTYMWGCGSDFDNVILSNAYKACGIKQPWSFWNNMCYRTVKNMNPSIKMDRIGTHHNAVDDAESQALHLIKIFNARGA